MLGGPIGSGRANSLMGEYSAKLGEAILRGRMRDAERVARIEAEVATRIKSEFISNMSHELRTPLNTVIGFSKLLAEHDRRPLGEGDVVEYARLIHDASCNLLGIINDILDISKMQSGQLRLDAADVGLDEVIEIVVGALSNQAQQSGVVVKLELGDDPLVVRGEQQKLRQAFGNMIGNAIKFTAGGGVVTIAAERERDGAVTVTIVDTGIGMSQEEVEVALAPFGQVDGARTRWREGTGLGLPIAKALIELHSGRIDIKSKRGEGTRVEVRFPPPELISFMQQDLGLHLSRT